MELERKTGPLYFTENLKYDACKLTDRMTYGNASKSMSWYYTLNSDQEQLRLPLLLFLRIKPGGPRPGVVPQSYSNVTICIPHTVITPALKNGDQLGSQRWRISRLAIAMSRLA